jgi:hypothetical protein
MPQIPLHISSLFIALVFIIAFMIIITVQACGTRLNLPFDRRRKNLSMTIIVIMVWLMFTLIIAMSGYLFDFKSTPPKILLVTIPPLVFILLLLFSKEFIELISPLGNFWFIYPQCFRILMELILYDLYRFNAVPVQMTFEGRNFDILTGLTAPFIAYYCFNKKIWSPKLALIWNFMGLILLLNIVVTAILSTPYPFRVFMNNPPDTIIFGFPFVWLPAFVVPFAFLLHLLSIRKLLRNEKEPEILQVDIPMGAIPSV